MSQAQSYWQRQTDKPLFPELEWSRPELKSQAGKLLIIGGNSGGFMAPAQAFSAAEAAGIGSCRVLLPSSLQKLVGKDLLPGEFAPSTPSGGLSRQAVADMIDNANWAEAVLIAGDLGHNSETVIAIDTFINKYPGQLTLTGETCELLANTAEQLLTRQNTTLVLELNDLQKLYKNSHQATAITSDIDLLNLVDSLHVFTEKYATNLIIVHGQTILVASQGQITSTQQAGNNNSAVLVAAKAAVWWLQNPSQALKALTTSVI